MKILYVANIRLPTEKAHGLQVVKMCEAFAREGHEVILAVPWRFGRLAVDPFEFYDVRTQFRIVRLFSLDLVRFGSAGFFVQVVTFAFASYLYARSSRADIIYGRDEVALSLVAKTGRVVWEVHTKKLNRFARILFQRARLIVAITGAHAELLKSEGVDPGKIVVAHDGVDVRPYREPFDVGVWRRGNGIPSEAKVVGYVGALHTMGRGKGVEELIRLFPKLLHEEPNAYLLLAGMSQVDRARAIDMAHSAGLRDSQFHINATPSQKDMVGYFRAANVHVMNYPNTEHYAKFMSPLKMFSYMASGIPIVTTDLPSVREILSDREAAFVPAGDGEILLKTVLEGLRGKFVDRGRVARELAKRYSWEARARLILESLRAVT